MATPQVRVSRYSVSALPEGHRDFHRYSVAVEERGDGRWAVTWAGECFDADLNGSHEPTVSNRTPDFTTRFRFPLEQALEIASKLAAELAAQAHHPA